MDRRSFLQSLAAIGLLPAADIPRLLQAPEAQEPAAAELVVVGLTLHPLWVNMRHEPIEVTSWADQERHYVRGRVSWDVELTATEGSPLRAHCGKLVTLAIVFPHAHYALPKAVLTHVSCDVIESEARWFATFEAP